MPTTTASSPALARPHRSMRSSRFFLRASSVIKTVRFASAPAISTPSAMAKTAGLLYIVGSMMSLAALPFPQMAHVHRGQLLLIGVASMAGGIAMFFWGARWPRSWYHVLIFTGNVVIGLSMYDGGGGKTSLAYATLYVFVAVNCFFFFTWPVACLHLSVAVLSCVVALETVGDANFGQVILVPGTLVVVALVVGWLVRAADAAELDHLTGMPNRRGIDRLLTGAVIDAAAGTHTLTLAFLDIDHFRGVNEARGQGGGDRLLREIAHAWRPLLRDGEVLARHGGDEFALIFVDAQAADVLAATDRLRAAIPSGHTCSAGIADWHAGDTVSLLTARADSALYESKRNGRNRVTYYNSSRDAEHAEILRAVGAGEVVAYYQPIIELGTGIVTGFEALARWIRPGVGMVPPDSFIPQAEVSGAIEDIGRAMLTAACRQVSVWSKIHGRPLVANVNVCGRELRNANYVAQVLAILADADLPASQLMLELTETAFEGDADTVVSALEEMHALGIRIAIDDFGTGYSSLSRLDRLPVDVVKIDRSFVSTLPAEATRAPLVAAITAMARALGLRVVAEGIEHPYQAALMAKLGCEEGQGYWFDRPCPAEQVDLSPRQAVQPDTAAAVRESDTVLALRIVG